MSTLEPFDPAIAKIEAEIVQFLIRSPLFLGQNPQFAIIKAYFITRKELTQEALKQLTGLSSGTISQEMKELLAQQSIQIKGKSPSGQLHYTMDSIELAFTSAFLHSYDAVLKWEKVFRNIKAELEEKKEDFKHLPGYKTIVYWINLILGLIAYYDQLLQLFKAEKTALERPSV